MFEKLKNGDWGLGIGDWAQGMFGFDKYNNLNYFLNNIFFNYNFMSERY